MTTRQESNSQRVSAFRGASKMPAMINCSRRLSEDRVIVEVEVVLLRKILPAKAACKINVGCNDSRESVIFNVSFASLLTHFALITLFLVACSHIMASQNTSDAVVHSDADSSQTLPDRTQTPADNEASQSESKNAAKKAAKMAKLAAEKAEKVANKDKGLGKQEAKKSTFKAPKKKIEGSALIGIDVSKDEDFPSWYQQILTKGDMLDYYDVSGCFILKVCPR